MKILLFLLFLSISSPAFPHGDEDHSGGSKPEGRELSEGEVFEVSPKSQKLIDLKIVPVSLETVSEKITALGRVTPKTGSYAQVYSSRPGRIISTEKSFPQVGLKVKKGQTLAMVEQVLSTTERVELARERIDLETQVLMSEKKIKQARYEVDRKKELVEFIASKEIKEAEVNLAILMDEYYGLKKQQNLYSNIFSNQMDSKNHFHINSPISGSVTASHFTVGEQVDTSKMLLEIMDLSEVWVVGDIFELDLSKIRNAKTANITSDAYPAENFKGTLVSVGQTFDEETRTVKAIFKVNNSHDFLKAGMFVNLSISIEDKKKKLIVPLNAVVKKDGKKIVYIKASDKGFKSRFVETGKTVNGFIEIKSGLKSGDTIVTTGSYQLQHYKGQ